MSNSIPTSHNNLLIESYHAVLTTLMPDGTPQSSVVWVDFDGEHVILSTTRERQKGRNIQKDPRVAILVIDPKDQKRWIALRGVVVEITEVDAEKTLDDLVRRYTDKKHYYGDIFPAEQRNHESRVTMKIEPVAVEYDTQ
jgi:PPOX class probable F420-dependent enzyme